MTQRVKKQLALLNAREYRNRRADPPMDPKEADERFEGESSYNFRKKMKLAFEIITSQSNKPLMFSVKSGFVND